MIKLGSARIYGVNRLNASDYGKYVLGPKRKQPKKKIKTQRNKFNNLMKQAKQRFYDKINEHFDDLKTVNSKMYWKTIHMLLKNDRSTN
jgi:formylmethanofuran dehydrogenase subunit E